MSNTGLKIKDILRFWLPLEATWLMMAVEGPFLAAVIARLAEPKFNLAAYGVSYSLAIFLEAPIIMIMSASTALVKDRSVYMKLRKFTYILNGIITVSMLILVSPPVFTFVTRRLIGLPEEVVRLSQYACILMLPWPAAIGYRRFFQGIMIRAGQTRRVAYGTIVRLIGMAMAALAARYIAQWEGALVGAAALSFGVTAEAVASRFMAAGAVRKLRPPETGNGSESPMTYRYIINFYFPLALTSMLALGVPPIETFFVGHSRMALESLAVLPVIYALVFIFRTLGLSVQEVVIALAGEKLENIKLLRKFALILAAFAVGTLGSVAFSPLASFWYRTVSGLTPELARFALQPTRIMTIFPGLMVLLSFQRGVLVGKGETKHITAAASLEVTTVFTLLFLSVEVFGMVGAVAATLALVVGRVMANGYLLRPVSRILRRLP